MPIETRDRIVPCAGCTLCCKNDIVRLLPEDDPSMYFTEPHPFMGHELMLAHDHKTQDCIYLKENGCGIHAFRPKMCREMDCRTLALVKGIEKLRVAPGVIERGRELLAAEKSK